VNAEGTNHQNVTKKRFDLAFAELAQTSEDQLCRNRLEVYRSMSAIALLPQGGARVLMSLRCTPTHANS